MINPEGLFEIVRRAQAGDRRAQEELLKRIRPDVERFAQRFDDASTGAESAADLAQEAAMRFWEKFRQFKGAADDESTAAMLHGWLQQLIRRLATNRHETRRAAKRRPDRPVMRLGVPSTKESYGAVPAVDPPDAGPTPSAVVGAAEIDMQVRAALHSIPDPTDRQILELCFLQSLSLRVVGEQLNISYEKVRERYHIALRFLERELGGLL